MKTLRINITNNGYSLKPLKQNQRTILESIKRTKELLLKKPENEILRNILEDELNILGQYNNYIIK